MAITLFAELGRNSAGTREVRLREHGARVDFERAIILVQAGGCGAVDILLEGAGVWNSARSLKSAPLAIANALRDAYPQFDVQVIFPVPFE